MIRMCSFSFCVNMYICSSKGAYNRRIVIGWMGVPDAGEDKKTAIDNFWQQKLTIPEN